ncbi:MAG: flap endonuclease-1, partial [Candidatus Aenigmatarchaeota archaeon]
RTSNFLEAGIKPIFVFDGEPPKFKKKTIEEREQRKKEATEKWDEALKKGEKAITYAQAASRLTADMIEESKKLLDAMGIPWLQAPSEGEAQCSYMCKKGDVWATGSQDADSLLFGSPILVKNMSISGRRKVPKKEVYVEIKPEIIELKKVLEALGINQRQLILIGMLIGTDYNPGGVKGFGPKKSLELVKENKIMSSVMKKVEWNSEIDPEEIFNFFIEPPVTEKYGFEWVEPNPEKILKFMSDEHDFSRERIEKGIERLQQNFSKGTQANLKTWFKK